jgi:hypothetical protein
MLRARAAWDPPINAANLRKAHALVESGKAIGKPVLVGF